jgi:hypothetical protein
MPIRWPRRLRTFLILTTVVAVAITCELVRRKIAYCRERASYSASTVKSLRRSIERYEKLATSGGAPAVLESRAQAKAECQARLRWYERAQRAFEHAATHPWVSTPHDPDMYVRGLPDSTYP